MQRAKSFKSLNTDLHKDINRGFEFIRRFYLLFFLSELLFQCLNGVLYFFKEMMHLLNET